MFKKRVTSSSSKEHQIVGAEMFCCWDLIFDILFQIPQGSVLEVGSWESPESCSVNMTFLLVM